MEPEPGSESTLIGRAVQLSRLAALLRSPAAGLICLSGPPGAGKSALVAAVLPLVAARFGGAHFVDLAETDPEGALARVRSAVQRVPARRGRHAGHDSPWEPELVIVDHAEELAGAEPEAEAAARLEGVTIVAMSTAPLGGPLLASVSLPPLAHHDARRLLLRRALLAGVDLPGDRTQWLDELTAASMGSPQIVGLIAARLEVTPPRDLVPLLAGAPSPLTVLTDPPGDGDAAALLPSLGAFSASFTAEAAGEVSDVTPDSADRGLVALMDLGLVHIDDSAAPRGPASTRYRLPRLVREFLRGRPDRSTRAAPRERHAAHFAELARRAATHREACDDLTAIGLLHDEYTESLAALRWLEDVSPGRAARLAVDLLPEADRRDDVTVVAPIAERLLRHDAAPEGARRDGLAWMAALDAAAPDAAERVPMVRERLAGSRAIADRSDRAVDHFLPLMAELLSLGVLRDVERARLAVRKGAALAQRDGHPGWQARFDLGRAHLRHILGDHEGAAEIGLSAWGRIAPTGDDQGVVYATLLLSRLPTATPDGPGGVAALRAALEAGRRLDNRRLQSSLLTMLALRALQNDDPEGAARWLAERYGLVARERSWHALGPHILLTMALSARLGHPEATARLHGALLQWSQLILAPLPGVLQDGYHGAVAVARDALGPEFDHRSREGARLSLEAAAAEAIDYVLQVADPAGREDYRDPAPIAPDLTTREYDVLRLLVSGNRNKEIADLLVISPKTVMHHTGAIYRKLGVRGRAEAAVAAVRLGLVPGP